jgi:RHS repeat-associated protein
LFPIDSNGNLTQKTEGTDVWGYEWNANNELTRVTKNSVEQARFAYDPMGRRVEKVAGGVTTTYAYDRLQVVREVRGSNTLKYVHGPGVDEPLAVDDGSVLTYYHADGLGSVVATSDTAGSATLTRQYDAWGNLETGANESGYAFAGREWDPEAKLYYYRARYYDPKGGRFISVDPLGFRGGLNFYSYVSNSPASYIDPTGLAPKRPGHWKLRYRECDAVESLACETMCGSKGVESCKVPQTFRPTRFKDGLLGWSWADGPMSCSCNDPEESICRRNPNTCAVAVGLAICILVVTPAPDDVLIPPLVMALR